MAAVASTLVLGVDGGGTKTLAVLAEQDGRIVGWGRAGNCDIYSNPAGAVAELERAVDAALVAAGALRSQISTAVYSLVGVDWPEDFDHWRDVLAERKLGERIVVVNDAIGALQASATNGDAVIVVCGTGAATGSRNAAGEMWHSSFWQLTQGGRELGAKALDAVYRAELGLGPATQLTGRLLGLFGAKDVEALLHASTCRALLRQVDPGRVPPTLFSVADSGDAVATEILRTHGEALGAIAATAARKVGILEKPFQLALAGGVLRNPSLILRGALLERLRGQAPFFVMVESGEPLRGAINLALTLSNGGWKDRFDRNLDASFPPASAFSTTDFDQATPRGRAS